MHADEATYEIAFGVVRRPTHYSTAPDLARFEVPGHRFADLSEHGFGVALLDRLQVRLQRVRRHAADQPAARAEAARTPRPTWASTRFAYALLPHAGGWQDAGVVAEARAFNAPLRWAGAVAAGGAWA